MTGNFILDDLGFVEAHVEYLASQSQMIQNSIRSDCPHFIEFQSYIRSKLFTIEAVNDFVENRNHPVIILNRLAYALEEICWHTLFAKERLDTIANWVSLPGGQDSIVKPYISYYFHGLVSRGKATIDILGLMINHLFKLGINRERCGLDRGSITAELSKIYNQDQDRNYVEYLYQGIDKYRNNWIGDFYNLRNVVIHRHQFGSLAVTASISNITHPFSILFREEDGHIEFIKKIAPRSIISGPVIDPTLFGNELWEKLVLLIEHVCKECFPQIDFFFSEFIPPDVT